MLDNMQREIQIGDVVTYWSAWWSRMFIGEIVSMTPKKVRVANFKIEEGYNGDKALRQSEDRDGNLVSPEKTTIINELVVGWDILPPDPNDFRNPLV